jgi:hypothetical protein
MGLKKQACVLLNLRHAKPKKVGERGMIGQVDELMIF